MSGIEATSSFPVDAEIRSLLDARTLELIERRRGRTRLRRRGWLVRRALLGADVVGLVLAFFCTELVLGLRSFQVDRLDLARETLLFVAVLPVWVLMAKVHRLYDRDEERTDHSTIDDIGGVFHMVTLGVWIAVAIGWLTGLAHPGLAKLLLFWALAIVLVPALRIVARAHSRRDIAFLQNTVIVGAGETGQLLARKLLNHPEYGINLVGFVDESPEALDEGLGRLALLGPTRRLPHLVRLLDVERVIVADPAESDDELLELIRELNSFDVQLDVVPRFFEVLSPGLGIHTVEGLALIGLPPPSLPRSSLLLKRLFDIATASILLTVLAPLFPYVSWKIKRESSGPVFFRQRRMGMGNRPFEILKFRTMVADAEARKEEFRDLNHYAQGNGKPRMFKINGDPRVTPFGRVLRRYFIDELPQLVNVLRGEMSLVGPRPLILDEDQYVGDWGRKRLELKPGMTGLWQVLGRNDISFEEMVSLDYLYVSTWSLWEDFRLLGRTIPLVLKGRGGSA